MSLVGVINDIYFQGVLSVVNLGMGDFATLSKILEIQFSGGEIMLSVELSPNGNVKFSSVYFIEEYIAATNISADMRTFMIEFNFETTSITFDNARKKEMKNNHSKTGYEELKKEEIKIYKYDQETAIQNFFFYRNMTEDNMLLVYENTGDILEAYTISGDLISLEKASIFYMLTGSKVTGSTFARLGKSLHADFKGRIHFFGGLDGKRVCKYC